MEAGPEGQEASREPEEQGASTLPTGPGARHERGDTTLENEDMEFDAGMVRYVQMVTSLIEGRPVSRDEILQMLNRTMRQHRLNAERRIDYILLVS